VTTETKPSSVDSNILVEDVGRVCVITLNRPEVRNALDAATARDLAAAVDRLDASPDLSVGILTGAGGTFCAGFDLAAFLRGESASIAGRGFGGIAQHMRTKPLIAAVEGWAVAGGFELVLSCDLIVAAANAQFGLPEVKRGLLAAGGGLVRLPQRLPYHVAMEIALTGNPLTARRAAEFGLVNAVAAEGEALAGALGLGEAIAQNAPLAVQGTRRVIQISAGVPEAVALEGQSEVVATVFASADAQEGARAFKEKRPPAWAGR